MIPGDDDLVIPASVIPVDGAPGTEVAVILDADAITSG